MAKHRRMGNLHVRNIMPIGDNKGLIGDETTGFMGSVMRFERIAGLEFAFGSGDSDTVGVGSSDARLIRLSANHIGVRTGDTIDLYANASELLIKVFTSAPALGDMSIGEIAIGDGTGGASEDELFFKPDASKIVVLQDDGTTRTIT